MDQVAVSFSIKPLSPHTGAEIYGIDLSQPVDEATRTALNQASTDHAVLAIRDQVVPPTLNLDNPSEGCDLDLVAKQAKRRKVRAALSNSFGFGGTNASLIFLGPP